MVAVAVVVGAVVGVGVGVAVGVAVVVAGVVVVAVAVAVGVVFNNEGEPMSKFDELTVAEARQLAAMFGGTTTKQCPFQAGSSYLIRTVTHYWTGRVSRICGDFLVLEDAAWIADTGRYSAAVAEASLNEVEPVQGEVILGLGAVVDAKTWTTPLPRTVK